MDGLIGLFGRRRAKLGEWPHGEVVAAAVAMLRDLGGELQHENGAPAGECEAMHFLVRGSRIRLCVEDYGDVTLCGPKRLVEDISKRFAARIPPIAGCLISRHSEAGHHTERQL